MSFKLICIYSILLFVILILLSMCNSDGDPQENAGLFNNSTISNVQSQLLSILSCYPSSNARGISQNVNLKFSFNQLIESSTINSNNIKLYPSSLGEANSVDGTTSFISGATYQFITSSSLGLFSNYTLKIKGGSEGIKAKNGGLLVEDYIIPFSTGHEIIVNGNNDFDPVNESFNNSSSNYHCWFTYDIDNIYFGFQGDDVSSNSPSKWLLSYIDVDPDSSNGSVTGQQYNTQNCILPFIADYHLRWKADNSYLNLMNYSNSWTSLTNSSIEAYQSGNYIEFKIPRASLNNPTEISLVLFMINETNSSEWTYAGCPSNAFSDGYGNPVVVSTFLHYNLSDLNQVINSTSHYNQNSSPPSVLSVTPLTNSILIANNSYCDILFNKPIDSSSINSSNIKLYPSLSGISGALPITITNIFGGIQWRIDPISDFSIFEKYSLFLSQNIKDIAGSTMISDVTSTFSTGHKIVIDGTDDFSVSLERYSTTSLSYTSYITYDIDNLYLGFYGDAVSTASANNFIFIYLDTVPSSGSLTGERYNEQNWSFANGMEYYYYWQFNLSGYEGIKSFTGSSWQPISPTWTGISYKNGNYFEVAIPLSNIGNPSSINFISFMIDQTGNGWTFSGCPNNSFTDGISSTSTPFSIIHFNTINLTNADYDVSQN